MSITIQAVYEGGVLRPTQPLPLAEGETYIITVHNVAPIATPLRHLTPEEEDYVRRLKATRSLEEMFAVMETAPPCPEDYDLLEALNQNRKAMGERPLFPDADEGADQ